MRNLLILLLVCLSTAAGAVDFDDTTRSLPLGRVAQVFEDVPGTADIDQIASGAFDSQFKPSTQDVLNAGYSKSVFWIRLNLRYLAPENAGPGNWLLELAYPPMDHIELYRTDETGRVVLAERSGDALPWSARVIKQNNYLFDLEFAPGQERVVYLRVHSQGSIQVPLTLWSPVAYIEQQPARIYVLGLIYGVLLVMLAYNLFIFLSVRDRSYLYYILYIGSFGLYQLSVNGAGIEFLWPESPWWANVATPFFIGLAAIFGSQFSRGFLQTAVHSPWLDRGLKGLMAFGAVVVALSLCTDYGLSLRLATTLALLFTLVVFSAGLVAWWRGQRVARYFLIAWSAFLAGGVVNTLMVLGHLPNIFITMYASQIGSALEVALLSLALADRINAMREQQANILLEAGQKLEALNQQLANSNRLKDEFLATVTHELRTPMNGVIGSLELMQTVNMDAELTQYQQTAADSARNMMRMVDDILTLTELQAGRLYGQREPFSLHAMLDSLTPAFATRAMERNLEFKVELEPGLGDGWMGDAKKLALCLSCLLDNAVKFTHKGSIHLRVRSLGRNQDGELLNFEVKDTGIGFAHLDESVLYQRFYQADSSMTRQYGGLGIGLAICRQVTELLGGQLRHYSQPGDGSRFDLSLRLAPQPIQVRTEPAWRLGAPAVRSAPQCKLLLVDDSHIDLLMVRGMLLKLGYQVRSSISEQAAFEQWSEGGFDAVVLDCREVTHETLSQCERWRARIGGEGVTLLALIPNLSAGDVQRLRDAGVTECLVRPARFEQLQATLHRQVLLRGEHERVDG